MSALAVENLTVSYGDIHAVKGVSFEVRKGEIFTIIGANGAGKSSALRAISGLLQFGGSVRLEGRELRGIVAGEFLPGCRYRLVVDGQFLPRLAKLRQRFPRQRTTGGDEEFLTHRREIPLHSLGGDRPDCLEPCLG